VTTTGYASYAIVTMHA